MGATFINTPLFCASLPVGEAAASQNYRGDTLADKSIVEAVKKAIELAKERNRKFRESVDLAINLKDVDLKNPKNRIEEEIILPHGRGKQVKVGVFATGELAFKSKDVADVVITPEEIDDLAENKRKAKKLANDIDFFIAEAPLMPVIGKKLGVVLGPRGKMPRPVPPNIDPKGIVETLRKTVKVRSKDRPTFHAHVGTVDMDPEQIADNIEAVLKRVESKLERGRMNIKSAYVKTTMGPAVRLW